VRRVCKREMGVVIVCLFGIVDGDVALMIQ